MVADLHHGGHIEGVIQAAKEVAGVLELQGVEAMAIGAVALAAHGKGAEVPLNRKKKPRDHYAPDVF